MAKLPDKPFSMRLPKDLRALLRAEADAKGLSESDLARMILIENLNRASSNRGGALAEVRSLAALIIAALSKEIDLEQAAELVADHLASNQRVAS